MAEISNSTADSLVMGTDGDDYIINYDGDRATLSGGKGNDTISNNYSWNVSMSGGEGTDLLMNINSRNVTVNAGKDYDIIYLLEDTYNNFIVYNDGDGDDYINGFSYDGEFVDIPAMTTISVASGTYSTMTSGTDLLVKVGDGVMTFRGVTSVPSVTILGKEDTAPAGVTISNNTANTLVTGTTNGDLISNTGADRVTIDGGAGVDSIANTNSWNSSLFGGDDNDVLINRNSRNVTLNGGKGDDQIVVLTDTADNLIVYNDGDGNDWVRGYDYDAEKYVGIGRNTTLQIGDGTGTCSTVENGDDVIVKVGEGQITLEGAATLLALRILGEITVDGLTISNNKTATLVKGSDGNDFLNNYNGDRSTLDGGKGNDTIANTSSYNVSLAGGTGNDEFLIQDSRYVTVNGGAGDDTIGFKNDTAYNLVIYNAGDGSDLIQGVDENNHATAISKTTSLQIGDDGKGAYSTAKSDDGKDVIVSVGNGRITLAGGVSLGTSFLSNNIIGSYSSAVSPNDKLVYLSEYDDTYTNNTDEALVYALGGNDFLTNRGDFATVDCGNGNDSIYNAITEKSVVIGGKGDDSIVNGANKATINCGDGDDEILNLVALQLTDTGMIKSIASAGLDVLLNGDDGDDYISNYGGDATINGGDGADTVYNYGALNAEDITFLSLNNKVIIDGGDGNDLLRNESEESDVTILGGGGQDSIYNCADLASLDGGEHGDAILSNGGDNVTINGGAGDDTLFNMGGEWVTLIGGKGDDWFSLGTDSLTIGKNRVMLLYTPGDGNDTVHYFNENATLQIGNGKDTYSKTTNGNDVLINVGNGQISLEATASLSALNILGTEVLALTNLDSNKITLDSSVDVVTAAKRTKAIQITGNALANSIVGGSAGDTLNGGKGDDTLTGGKGSDVFVYKKGTGNDYIKDYAEEDIISIASGTADEVVTSGKNVIFKVGSNRITIKGAAEKIITYFDTNGQHYYPAPVSVNADGTAVSLLSSYNGDTFDVTSNSYVSDYAGTLKTLDASAVTHDLTVTGNKLANRIVGSEENDLIDGSAGKDTILGGDGNDTLIGGTGNDNLTGGKGADTFVYAAGDGNDLITDYDEEDKLRINGVISKIATTTGGVVVFHVDGGKVSVKSGASKIVSYEDADAKQYFYPVNINAAGTAATLLSNYTKDTFDVAKYGDYAGTLKTINASAVTHDLTITGNKLANKILGGSGNDTLIGGKGNDTLTGGKGSDLFVYNSGNGNDLITDYAEEDKLRINGVISKIATTMGGVVVFHVDGSKVSVKGGASKVVAYEDADAKQYFYPVNFNAAGTAATLLAEYTKDTFDVAKYGDYSSTLKTINASAVTHDLIITGNKLANKILGGSGNDTLIGGKGNDSLNGGKGSDVFVYNSGDGNDTIASYAEEDRLQINGTVSNRTTSGKNVILTVGDYKITLKSAAGKVITYTDNTAKFNADGTSVTLTNKYTADAFDVANYPDYAGTVKTINGAAVTHNVSITANSKENTIYGSKNNDYMDGGAAKDVLYGSEGNDSLRGGTGNDTLWGGDGADVFVYTKGDGSDVIKDYAEGEKISITGAAVSKATVSGGDVVLTIGSNTITVTDGKGKTISYSDSKGKHTYPDAVNDLFVDDNYSADAAQLSQIVEPVKASYTPYDFDARADFFKRDDAPALTFVDKK